MKECLSSANPFFFPNSCIDIYIYRFIYSNALQLFNLPYFRICAPTVWCCELRVHIIQEKIIFFGSMRQCVDRLNMEHFQYMVFIHV